MSQDYELTDDPRQATVIVVNSCTVTHRSDQQVRQLARRMRRENSRARLLITGCYAQRDAGALAKVEGIDAVVGNTWKHALVQIAEATRAAKPSTLTSLELAEVYREDFRKVRILESRPVSSTGGKTRPFVKIQDGCDARCSYCIIPIVRGISRSLPPNEVVRQVRGLAEAGFREVVLTGIHIGTYGVFLTPRYSLARLLGDLLEVSGLERLRVSSIEPMELSRKVIYLAAHDNRIAPHFHICLQSGCDSVLRRMLRPYNRRRFASIVEEIVRRIPDAAIGTDVITGFPGETESEHRESLRFVEEMPFAYLHVFPYSDRKGTRASTMSNKVDAATRKERTEEFLQLAQEKKSQFRRRFLGALLSVITLDEQEVKRRVALSANYLKVRLPLETPVNQILTVKVVAEEEGELIGEPA